MKFVSKGLINNIPALVQIMAWRRTGDKPLSEPMITQFNDAYMRHSASTIFKIAQVVENLLQRTQGHVYHTLSMPLLLISDFC